MVRDHARENAELRRKLRSTETKLVLACQAVDLLLPGAGLRVYTADSTGEALFWLHMAGLWDDRPAESRRPAPSESE